GLEGFHDDPEPPLLALVQQGSQLRVGDGRGLGRIAVVDRSILYGDVVPRVVTLGIAGLFRPGLLADYGAVDARLDTECQYGQAADLIGPALEGQLRGEVGAQ